jgi:hypothetical protein
VGKEVPSLAMVIDDDVRQYGAQRINMIRQEHEIGRSSKIQDADRQWCKGIELKVLDVET